MESPKDDSLPSYAESTSGPAPPLQQQIQSTRLTHISAVVHGSIMPILNDRAARGLSHSTIALLPLSSSDESAFVPSRRSPLCVKQGEVERGSRSKAQSEKKC
jgi:hypothetical protein